MRSSSHLRTTICFCGRGAYLGPREACTRVGCSTLKWSFLLITRMLICSSFRRGRLFSSIYASSGSLHPRYHSKHGKSRGFLATLYVADHDTYLIFSIYHMNVRPPFLSSHEFAPYFASRSPSKATFASTSSRVIGPQHYPYLRSCSLSLPS